MIAKLTLTIEKSVNQKAKNYAKGKETRKTIKKNELSVMAPEQYYKMKIAG